ncbi:hypothetical protein [Bradyrhizobium iriomotense]|uniref:Uncharacterized protein n=1 Tax=Bradyrhizobium iriomotense TaxID=441950 RepID=A0ABQ6ANL4_9BRAD|nr:hypothetical protein [Bradyrhizobium iriomotense]GLR83495.1 hypothetical protein GCM10007857_02050 [Bradyrhizobium iriomotense]
MVAVVRLDRRIHGWNVGRGGIVVLHRLQAVVGVRRSVGTAGFREKLVRRNGLLMIHLRRDLARQMSVLRRTLIMTAAMERLSGIALMGLSQREIFARRRRRGEVAVMFTGNVGDVVRVLERGRAADGVEVRAVVVGLRLRDQVVIGLRGIGHVCMPLARMQTRILVGLMSTMVLADVQSHVVVVIVIAMVLADVQSHVTMVIMVAVVLTSVQSGVAAMVMIALVLADVQTHVAVVSVVAMVLTCVQPHVVMAVVIAVVLSMMQSGITAIGIMCAGWVPGVVIG